jgi:ADP-heptose:LPS heptosyltransferase
MRPHVLVVRLDNEGDVLLAGPAVRAIAHRARRVTFLCGRRGRAAAELLPGVDDVVEFTAPWIDPEPQPVSGAEVERLVAAIAEREVDAAVVLTSFHQSPLPTALVLRLAGVPRIAAISPEYPGSLLDVRHQEHGDVHEVERNLGLARAAGFPLPPEDDSRLAITPIASARRGQPYVVVHPGASVPARTWSPDRFRDLVAALRKRGAHVRVTGGPGELDLTSHVAGATGAVDLGGRSTLGELASVLAGASTVVVGNTGPAHLAAAVGTPVVSIFPPTVPAARWHPWGVPHVVLGRQDIGCAGCRAKVCPIPGHPCVDEVTVEDALAAVDRLSRRPAPEVSRTAKRAKRFVTTARGVVG